MNNTLIVKGNSQLQNGILFFIIFCSILLAYFLFIFTLYLIGIEPIYRHIPPFYALWKPIYPSIFHSLQLPFFILIGGFSLLYIVHRVIRVIFISLCSILMLFFLYIQEKSISFSLVNHVFLFLFLIIFIPLIARILQSNNFYDTKKILLILVGIYFFYVFLSIEVASIRDGFIAISQPYQRTKYEYIGDIGITKNIYELFNRYHEIQSHLSLHGRLAPPGPLFILWFCSYLIGKEPLALSLLTIFFGGLAIFPLFLWIKKLFDNNTTIAITGVFLYSIIPSLVLFCATSTEILYMPFLFLVLWTFEKSLKESSFSVIFLSGIFFAILSLFKFTLLSVGIYFILRGIALLYFKQTHFLRLFFLGLTMFLGFILFYFLLCSSTGYKPVQVFFNAQKMFRDDIQSLQIISPRYSLWWFKLFTPLSWIYFTGIPILFGFINQLRTKERIERTEIIVFLLTLLILNFAYIAPGEGERSALYVFPFFLIPALRFWQHHFKHTQVFVAVSFFLLFQIILTESLFYTYW